MKSNLTRDLSTGEFAVQAMLSRVLQEKGIEGVSLGGSKDDLERGVDYQLMIDGELVEGSHRHMSGKHKGVFCLRASRSTGVATDLQKLADKADTHLYSFSWGYIDTANPGPVSFVSAKNIKKMIATHPELKATDLFGDGNTFLCIPESLFPDAPIRVI